eukprot:TRINITY_DN15754_c0_g1_i5.p1 TRINITY_DN15754_c0_g1~~TRINITY_DN15754_c0_g1_i5.p1  ORF type:complete len:241 (+),score=-22.74 TRINITY_DN15754_c0_g1_i5:722-1444(+)
MIFFFNLKPICDMSRPRIILGVKFCTQTEKFGILKQLQVASSIQTVNKLLISLVYGLKRQIYQVFKIRFQYFQFFLLYYVHILIIHSLNSIICLLFIFQNFNMQVVQVFILCTNLVYSLLGSRLLEFFSFCANYFIRVSQFLYKLFYQKKTWIGYISQFKSICYVEIKKLLEKYKQKIQQQLLGSRLLEFFSFLYTFNFLDKNGKKTYINCIVYNIDYYQYYKFSIYHSIYHYYQYYKEC